jgi:hypothetical protein
MANVVVIEPAKAIESKKNKKKSNAAKSSPNMYQSTALAAPMSFHVSYSQIGP